MPRAYSMSWESHPHYRWVKMYKGCRHRVHCSELGLPRDRWTRDGSAVAANEWWTRKRAEVDSAAERQHPHADILAELAERLRVGKSVNAPEGEMERLEGDLQFARELPADLDAARVLQFGRLSVDRTTGKVNHERSAETHDAVWNERKRIVGTVSRERSVGVLAERWLDRRREKHAAGALSVSGTAQSKYRIDRFVAFVGADTGVEGITADRWERWHTHLLGAVNKGEWSGEWSKNLFATSKQFVRWLWQTEVLDNLPRNFDALKLRGSPARDIAVFDVADVRAMLAAATPRFRLYLLLMLNCGLYQGDISELRRSEVDLVKGTITRQRSKTRGKGDVPTVTYALWPETVKLLREFMASDGEFALLNEDGKRLVRETLKADGTHSKTDAIRQAFDRLKEKVGVAGSIKLFRKTSASYLNTHTAYRSLVPYFLGHAPRSIAERHYARESDELLATAIEWLRGVYAIGKKR